MKGFQLRQSVSNLNGETKKIRKDKLEKKLRDEKEINQQLKIIIMQVRNLDLNYVKLRFVLETRHSNYRRSQDTDKILE